MKRVTLSRAAEADLDAIDDYTIEQFGLGQAERTAAAFMTALEALADNPRSGRLDEELSPPGRPFRFWPVLGAFIIVYEPGEQGIRVARILHGARHIQNELERDHGEQ